MDHGYRYFFLYLGVVFGVAWTAIIGCAVFAVYLKPFIGELTLTHPLIIFVLYLPSMTGLFLYYKSGGMTAVRAVFLKLIPRKQDLFWFPILFVVFVFFALVMRYGSLLLGIDVPQITLRPQQMILKALWNFIEETGLLGGIFGWIAFLLPFLQAKLKNNVYSGLLTGLLFGFWVFPGYGLSSIADVTSYLLYVAQLMAFIVFASYIFNLTKGNLSLYLFAFWLAATGSHIQLYYFNMPVQIMELAFLTSAALVMHFLIKKTTMDWELQKFPDFIAKDSLNQPFKPPIFDKNYGTNNS